MSCVYLHKRAFDKQVFYVGIGRSERRAFNFSDRNAFWKRYVAKHGEPLVHIVLESVSDDHAKEAEVLLIEMIGRRKDGGTLVNITLGGDAQPMHVPEVVEKVRTAMKGRQFSDETRGKMSASAKNRGGSEGARLATIERRASGWHPMITPEARAKVSAAIRGIKRSDEHRRKNGEAHSKGVVQFSKDGQFIAWYKSARDAAKILGCTSELIGMCCRGRCETGKGFKWAFCPSPHQAQSIVSDYLSARSIK